jgi:hypothetical protein
LAVLLLASGDLLPRQRARDQQADRAGMDLKRRVLDWVAARDPEPDDLEAVLMEVVEEIGPPTGPTRSVARAFFDDWEMAGASPEWLAQLVGEAVSEKVQGNRRGGRLPS